MLVLQDQTCAAPQLFFFETEHVVEGRACLLLILTFFDVEVKTKHILQNRKFDKRWTEVHDGIERAHGWCEARVVWNMNV